MSQRTPEEILAELEDRFRVNTTVRSLPPHMASSAPAHNREQKPSASIGVILPKWRGAKNGKGGKFRKAEP